MARVKNIVILQKSDELPDNLRTNLRDNGFSSTTVFDERSVLQKIQDVSFAFVLIDCGEGAARSAQQLSKLFKHPDLLHYPTVVLSSANDEPPEVLCSKFLKLATLPLPCTSTDVLELLEEFNETLKEFLLQLQSVAPDKVPEFLLREQPGVWDPLPSEPGLSQSFAQDFFDRLSSLGLSEASFDAAKALIDVGEEGLEQAAFMPADRGHQVVVREIRSNLTEVPQRAARNKVYMCGQMTGVLPVSERLRSIGLIAMNVLPAGFEGKGELLTVNFLNDRLAGRRADIVAGVKVSADYASKRVSEEVAALLRDFSVLLAGNLNQSDNEEFLLLSTLAAADITDRACREDGHWFPALSHVFMNKILRGELRALHPTSVMLALRYVVDMASSTRPSHLIPGKIREKEDLRAQHESARSSEKTKGERKISIIEIQPGMRLSRELLAFDGRQLLPEGSEFDEDLILRLWRVGTVRVLNTPLFIVDS
jgi:hypothetical protein